jgi:hypothetical protein
VEYAVADVGGQRCGPDAQELQLQRRDPLEEAFAGAQGDRGDVGAELIDQAGGQGRHRLGSAIGYEPWCICVAGAADPIVTRCRT